MNSTDYAHPELTLAIFFGAVLGVLLLWLRPTERVCRTPGRLASAARVVASR